MKLLELDANSYLQNVSSAFSLFDTVPFAELNRHKVDRVHYLLFADERKKFALIGGEKNGVFRLPFSASFCAFTPLEKNIRLEFYHQAVAALVAWCRARAFVKIENLQPPLFYAPSHLSKMQNALLNNGFCLEAYDLNYEYDLTAHSRNVCERLSRAARKNFRTAERARLVFSKTEDFSITYHTIRKNRQERGFPLHMSLDEVRKTAQFIPTDLFVVRTQEGLTIAAAVVHRMSEQIVRVVYWGSLKEYEAMRPVNFLAENLFEFYTQKNFRIADIGTSTVEGIPNFGLCNFKEGIGCRCSPKLLFTADIATRGGEEV